VLGSLAWARLGALQERALAAYGEYVDRAMEQGPGDEVFGPWPVEGVEPIDMAVRGWAEGSRLLQAICDARTIAYLHVLQPTLHDEGSKPVTTEEVDKGRISKTWLVGVREGYPRLRAAGEQLRASGVRFVDASRVFEDVEEPLYRDRCHLNLRGNVLLGAAIMPALLAELP
jgi:hypothetical protein